MTEFWRSRDMPQLESRRSCQAVSCYRPHTHDRFSIGLIDAGQAVFAGSGDTRCELEPGDVLRLLERAGLGELTRAVERALELGVADADAVRLVLEHRRERPAGLFCLDGRPHLKLVAVPAPDLSAYASLTAGVAS